MSKAEEGHAGGNKKTGYVKGDLDFGIRLFNNLGEISWEQVGWDDREFAAVGKKRVRGTEVDVMMQPKIKFEIVVSSEEWEKATIDAIQKAAFTGEVGDGKIFSYEIRTATKIRTRESGADALN